MGNVISGAKGILSVQSSNGTPVPVALCDSISIDESVNLVEVTGIGKMFPDEIVPTIWKGSGSLSFYATAPSKNLALLQLDNRIANTPTEWTNYLLTRLKEDGGIITVMTKEKTGQTNPAGVPILKDVPQYVIKYVFVNRQSFRINEGQVAKVDVGFVYTEPFTIVR